MTSLYEKQLIEFAQLMVQTPSLSGEEGNVAKIVKEKLIELGYHDVRIDEKGNVIGVFGQGEPTIMFNGHIDHVPVYGMDNPYSGEVVDGSPWGISGDVIRGRGSCDMKANVAAGLFAPVFLDADSKSKLKGSYIFTADVEEETDSPNGIPFALANGLRAKYGLSGESTQVQLSLGHRGKIQFDLTIEGVSCHAAAPDMGVSAIYEARPFIDGIEELHRNLPGDDLYGNGTIAITRIQSFPKTDVAVVPPRCVMRLDRRYIPGETPDSVERDLREYIEKIAKEHDSKATLARVSVYPLMTIDPENSLVDEGLKAIKSVTGKDTEPMTWKFGVNATFMSKAGIPCIGIGPGNEDYAHTPEEHVPTDDLVQCSKIYAQLIKQLCS